VVVLVMTFLIPRWGRQDSFRSYQQPVLRRGVVA
jgi:hypothetical protein